MPDFPKLKDAWIWPEAVERWFRERAEGYTLHVCCGRSQLGDVRLDVDPDRQPDVVGDMHSLPFPTARFDTAIWDPPWKWAHGQYKRHQAYFELVRVVKPDGVLLWNTTWIPTSDRTLVEDLAVRQDNGVAHTSVVGQSRKHPGQTTL